jgi:hypothetical protein
VGRPTTTATVLLFPLGNTPIQLCELFGTGGKPSTWFTPGELAKPTAFRNSEIRERVVFLFFFYNCMLILIIVVNLRLRRRERAHARIRFAFERNYFWSCSTKEIFLKLFRKMRPQMSFSNKFGASIWWAFGWPLELILAPDQTSTWKIKVLCNKSSNYIPSNFLEASKVTKFTNIRGEVRRPPTTDSYRRYICKGNIDAPSASWLSSGRACMCKTRRVFSRSGDFDQAKVLVNLEN